MFYRHRDTTIWPIGLMTIIATVLLGMGIRPPAPIAIALIAGPMALFLTTGWPRLPRPRLFLHLLMAVPFFIWFKYESQAPGMVLQLLALFILGFFMLALSVHNLLSLDRGGKKDTALGCTLLAMGFAGASTGIEVVYVPLAILFCVLLLLHLRWELVRRSPRRSPTWAWPRYLGPVVVLIGMTTFNQGVVVPWLPDASRKLVERVIKNASRDPGFTRQAKLGNMNESLFRTPGNNKIVLRVWTERLTDPYLRGAVYDNYYDGNDPDRKGTWSPIDSNPLGPTELKSTGTYLGRHLYNSEEQAPPAKERVGIVYAEPEVAADYFLPLGTHQIATVADHVIRGAGETLHTQGEDAQGGYIIYKPTVEQTGKPQPSRPGERPPFLQVPNEIRKALERIVREALPDDSIPTIAKLHLLEGWFVQNGFTYKIGIEIATGEDAPDPLLQFLLGKERAAHCEYFASAAVMMLRLAGIQARYVTGFVADEPGMGGGWWVARRRHAHAWAEAWVDGEGWVRVEATPPDGRPETHPPTSKSDRWNDWLAAQWGRFKQLALYGGLVGLLGAAWDTVASLPQQIPVSIWVLMITVGTVWIFRDSIRAAFRRRTPDTSSQRVRDLRRKLADAEKRLRTYGLMREPGTTAVVFRREVRSSTAVPPDLRAHVLPLLDEYVSERFRRE